MRVRFSGAAATLIAATAPLGAGPASAQAANPCHGPGAKHLLCPNLRIGPPIDFYLEHAGGGHLRLRATSDVRSRGLIEAPTRASLRFTDVGGEYGGSYWKAHQLARFELRRVGRGGALGPVVRTGPKLNYCLRDLFRTRAGRRSPKHRHYPGCNQNPSRRAVTLGTSVGWSDIYPADYDK
ncbi:MAG TPA: hypothetical protein VHU86_05235 [Solirubrobacterales bacterium]|nr:hypothetical protein [Solirubrobacterales bacterium]